MINSDNRKLVIAISSFIVLCIAMIILAIINNLPPTVKSIPITNFTEQVNNIPESEQGLIEQNLYHVSSMNVDDGAEISKDTSAIIRDGSYNQTFENDIYKTTFIVDIESLKMSFSVENLYTDLSIEESGLIDYTIQILCLPTEDLIYGEFNCSDRLSQERNLESSDPILKHLPYSTVNYEITAGKTEDGSLSLDIRLMLSEADYRSDTNKIVNSYELEIMEWIESLGLDPYSYSPVFEY